MVCSKCKGSGWFEFEQDSIIACSCSAGRKARWIDRGWVLVVLFLAALVTSGFVAAAALMRR